MHLAEGNSRSSAYEIQQILFWMLIIDATWIGLPEDITPRPFVSAI